MNYEDPLVSVIVPIYNVEKYLDKCLESIRTQFYSNIEVLMVNDGSTDNSREIALHFQTRDKRFQLIDKANGGLSSARNKGLDMCKGKFVCFVDSDDFISKGYISSMIKEMEENDKVDVVVCGYTLYNNVTLKGYSQVKEDSNRYYSEEEKFKRIIMPLMLGEDGSYMSVWKNMYRSSVISENNLRYISEREVYTEDKLFNLEFYSISNIVCEIASVEYYHLINYGSLSQSYRENFVDMLLKCNEVVRNITFKYYGNEYAKMCSNISPADLTSILISFARAPFLKSYKMIKGLYCDARIPVYSIHDISRLKSLRHKIILAVYVLTPPASTFITVKTFVFLEPIYRWLKYRLSQKCDV